MARVLYGIIVLCGTLFGAILAYQVDRDVLADVQGFEDYSDPRMLLAILLGGLGYLGTATLTWELEKWVEGQLPHLKLRDVLAGVAGLAFGFLMAGLFMLPIALLLVSQPIKEFVGPALSSSGVLLPPIVACLFGYLGMRMFVKKSQDLPSLLGGGPPTLAPKILDTSVIIDGRILDLIRSHFLEGSFIVPEFCLAELHHISDSSDTHRRARGRRGLEMLEALRTIPDVEVTLVPDDYPQIQEVDAKLVQLTRDTRGTLFTIDASLHKVALIKGIRSVNLNEVTNALRPACSPGDVLELVLMKQGKERRQAVSYLNDGSMVVVENGSEHLGETCRVAVSSVLKTSAGRMVFAELVTDATRDDRGESREGTARPPAGVSVLEGRVKNT